MKFDEVLLLVVGVMLIASTAMGYSVQRLLRHSKKALEALRSENDAMMRTALDLKNDLAQLKRCAAALEGDAWVRTRSPQPPSSSQDWRQGVAGQTAGGRVQTSGGSPNPGP